VVIVVPLRGTPGHLILASMPWVTSWFSCLTVLNHTILYVYSIDILMWNTTKFNFQYHDTFVICYDFLKI
jgi:hypothetical protein